MPENPTPNEAEFNNKKRDYFVHLGLSVKEALKLHRSAGLWERKDGKREWGNVSEHCLVEVARVNILADKLKLSAEIKKDLAMAAALHDFFKKGEKEIITAGGIAWASFENASAESTNQMQAAGFEQRIIDLANSVGHGSLLETQDILKKDKLSPQDVAYLVMHYVDDYTVGSDWSKPSDISKSGQKINDLDRRMDKNEANKRYAQLNEEGKEHFNGETAFEAQRRIGHLVEQKLAAIISEKTGKTVDALDLPQLVDADIKTEISSRK